MKNIRLFSALALACVGLSSMAHAQFSQGFNSLQMQNGYTAVFMTPELTQMCTELTQEYPCKSDAQNGLQGAGAPSAMAGLANSCIPTHIAFVPKTKVTFTRWSMNESIVETDNPFVVEFRPSGGVVSRGFLNLPAGAEVILCPNSPVIISTNPDTHVIFPQESAITAPTETHIEQQDDRIALPVGSMMHTFQPIRLEFVNKLNPQVPLIGTMLPTDRKMVIDESFHARLKQFIPNQEELQRFLDANGVNIDLNDPQYLKK